MMAVQGLLWVVLGILRTGPERPIDWISVLLFINAGLFILIAVLHGRVRRLALPAAVFIAVNLSLSLTDQTGILDFIVFGLDAACLALLTVSFLSGRRQALKKAEDPTDLPPL